MSAPLDVAIIGVAGVYPKAANAQAFWHNICAKVDAITEAGPEWAGNYFDPDSSDSDRIYTTRGGFLGELAQVDPLDIGLMPALAAGADPDHLIALKMARDAIADAGYAKRSFNNERTGVIVARGTYGNRGFASMLTRGFFLEQMMQVIRQLRPDFSATEVRELQRAMLKQLPPYGGDMVGLLTPNAIAGVIANRLDLMGPNYIVDAACASSLIAVSQAAQEIASGRCDTMLVGGTQVQTPAMLYIQFSQINALTRGQLRPFSKGSDGTLLGEGSGMMMLKRLDLAEAHGDRIYAVIKGTGIASDGKAKGFLTPRLEGEILAMQRAYESCGIDPLTLDLIEAHGTGTALGDKTEIEALQAIYGARGAGPQIALSAVKSMIGHCLPGTATASMIKTAFALHHKVLPPMLCGEPDPALHLERTPFYLNTETRPWIHGGKHPRRAGVNAFGFGGINAHVVLEEYRPRATGAVAVPQVLTSDDGGELLLLAAESHAQLLTLARAVQTQLNAAKPAALAAICKAAAQHSQGAHRLAIPCTNAADLAKKLDAALDKLSAGAAFKTRNGVQYSVAATPGKVVLLFPGEGSQYPDMLRDLALRFAQVREGFDFIEQAAHARGSRSRAARLYPAPTGYSSDQRQALEADLHSMDIGAESVFSASLALLKLYDDLGLQFDAMLGHSTGENTALTASGVRHYDSPEALAEAVQVLHQFFERLDADGQIVQGTLLSVGGLDAATRAELLAGVDGMQLAMDNCPNQLVLFGAPEAAEKLRARLAAQGAICQPLPFGRAYHTPLFKPMADAFRSYFKDLEFTPGRVPLYSACSVAPFPQDAAAMRELAAKQWENPVRFTQTIERLYDEGYRVFLEVGPGGNLTSFVGDTLRARSDVLALASDSRRRGGLAQLHSTLAALFCAGAAFDPQRLYSQRRLAALDLLAPPAAAKPSAQDHGALQMPQLHLPPQWQRPPPTTVAAPAAEPARAPAAAPAPTAPPATATAPAAPSDPRSVALQAHFALMQDFLDSQARVLGLLDGHAPVGAALAANEPAPRAPSASLPDLDPAFPLLGRISQPRADQLESRRCFDLETDKFLRDHCIGGTPSARAPEHLPIPVVPFTFSMEICAQAAARLIGNPALKVIALENARGSRWLSLDDGRLNLRINAQKLPAQGSSARVQVRLFVLDNTANPQGVGVFEAQVLLAADYPAAPTPLAWQGERRAPVFNADQRLYAHGMFHGARLQGAVQVQAWNPQAIDVELRALPTHDFFGFTATPTLQLDAALADAIGQTYFYWLQELHGDQLNCFPFSIARLSLFAPPPVADSRFVCRAQIQQIAPDQLRAQADAIGADGRVVMRVENWDDRTFAVPARFHTYRLNPPTQFLGEPWLAAQLPQGIHARRIAPFDEALLDQGGGIWGRSLAHMALTPAERAFWYGLPASSARRSEWLLGRLAAKEAARDWARARHGMELASIDIAISGDDRGKPRVQIDALGAVPMPALSISHSHGWAAAVVADPGLAVGVDYQRLRHLRAQDLIQGAFAPAEQHWFAQADASSQGLIAAALWCAKEAASKAAGSGLQGRPQDWLISACHLQPAQSPLGSARVAHGGQQFDVVLQFEGSEAISALCLHAPA